MGNYQLFPRNMNNMIDYILIIYIQLPNRFHPLRWPAYCPHYTHHQLILNSQFGAEYVPRTRTQSPTLVGLGPSQILVATANLGLPRVHDVQFLILGGDGYQGAAIVPLHVHHLIWDRDAIGRFLFRQVSRFCRSCQRTWRPECSQHWD